MANCSSSDCSSCTGTVNQDLKNCTSTCTDNSCFDACISTYGLTNACRCQNDVCISSCDDNTCKQLYGDSSYCVNGGCVVTPCDGDCSNYGENFSCVNGVCSTTSCSDDSGCPEGSQCLNGLCVGVEPRDYSIWLFIIVLIILVIVAILLILGIKKLWKHHKSKTS